MKIWFIVYCNTSYGQFFLRKIENIWCCIGDISFVVNSAHNVTCCVFYTCSKLA